MVYLASCIFYGYKCSKFHVSKDMNRPYIFFLISLTPRQRDTEPPTHVSKIDCIGSEEDIWPRTLRNPIRKFNDVAANSETVVRCYTLSSDTCFVIVFIECFTTSGRWWFYQKKSFIVQGRRQFPFQRILLVVCRRGDKDVSNFLYDNCWISIENDNIVVGQVWVYLNSDIDAYTTHPRTMFAIWGLGANNRQFHDR